MKQIKTSETNGVGLRRQGAPTQRQGALRVENTGAIKYCSFCGGLTNRVVNKSLLLDYINFTVPKLKKWKEFTGCELLTTNIIHRGPDKRERLVHHKESR